MIGRHLHASEHAPSSVQWYLDRPVANSGRLRALLLEIAEQRGYPWSCELVNNPDAVLIHHAGIVATSDAWILDQCTAADSRTRWFDLLSSLLDPGESAPPLSTSGPVLAARPGLWLLDLAPDQPPRPPSEPNRVQV
jgi:hypothetical protein